MLVEKGLLLCFFPVTSVTLSLISNLWCVIHFPVKQLRGVCLPHWLRLSRVIHHLLFSASAVIIYFMKSIIIITRFTVMIMVLNI